MRTPQLALALGMFAATSALSGQSGPCFTNAVPNGGFESLLVDPWAVTGRATATYGPCSADGLTTSRCLDVTASGDFTVAQATPIQLTAGVLYQVWFDIDVNNCCGIRVDVGLTNGGNRTSALATAIGRSARSRPTALFTVPGTGPYTIDLAFTSISSNRMQIDNVTVRPNAFLFQVEGALRAGATSTWRVTGTPNSNFAVLLGTSGVLAQGVPLSICTGRWWLNLPTVELVVGTLDAQGSFTGTFTVPQWAAGIPLDWQPVLLPPGCAFGCPTRYGFF